MADGKTSGKTAGGLNRYAHIGGTKHVQANDALAPERLNVSVTRSQSVKASEHQDVKTSEHQSPQMEKQKQKRNRVTAYLDPEIDRWIRHRIADTREDISDVINKGVRLLMEGK
jgi:hypothetical protein